MHFIDLSDEIYYLLDFCNSYAPKSTAGYVDSKATARKTRTKEAQCGKWRGRLEKGRLGGHCKRKPLPSAKWQTGQARGSPGAVLLPAQPGLSDSVSGEIIWKALGKAKSMLQMLSDIIPLSLININIIHSKAGNISCPGHWGEKFGLSIFF